MKRLKTILQYLALVAILAIPAGVVINIFAIPAEDVEAQTFTNRQAGSNLVGYQDYTGNPGSIFWVNSATGTDSASRGRYPGKRCAKSRRGESNQGPDSFELLA